MATDFNEFSLKSVPAEAIAAAQDAIVLNLAASGLEYAARILRDKTGEMTGFVTGSIETIDVAVATMANTMPEDEFIVERPSAEFLRERAQQLIQGMDIPD